ncbi:MAG: hypothetical protein H7Y11_12100, partial [Armatimonadetes bacterium]|nr:hypothetical protein [Anaerolineae bacterium]
MTMLKAILFDLDDTLIDWGGFTIGWENMESQHLANVFDHFQFEQRPQIDLKSYTAEYVRRVRESWVEARNTLRAPHLGRLLVDSAVAVGVPIEAVDMQRCLEAY